MAVVSPRRHGEQNGGRVTAQRHHGSLGIGVMGVTRGFPFSAPIQEEGGHPAGGEAAPPIKFAPAMIGSLLGIRCQGGMEDSLPPGRIRCGQPGGLPTEGELGHELGVSRGTLRNALATLFKEGVLQPGGRGGRHAVNTPVERDKKSCAPLPGNLVRLLSPQPRSIRRQASRRLLRSSISKSLQLYVFVTSSRSCL